MNSTILKNILNPVKKDLDQLNQRLVNTIGLENSFLEKIVKHIISSGGKRLRPALVFMIAKTLNNDEINQNHIKLAESIELIHTATLVHDDVIDNSDTRRNAPTVNALWDEKTAVIAGDYLLSQALIKLSETQSTELANTFAKTMKEICVGEIQQNLQAKKIISIEEYIEKSKRKTAMLFALATKGAAMLTTGINKKQIEAAEQYGLNIGIAFQIADDISNFKSKDSKPVLNDIQNGTITAPIIYAIENNKKLIDTVSKKTYSKKDINNILENVENSKSIEKTVNLANIYIKNSQENLKNLTEGKNTDSLVDFANYCIKRI